MACMAFSNGTVLQDYDRRRTFAHSRRFFLVSLFPINHMFITLSSVRLLPFNSCNVFVSTFRKKELSNQASGTLLYSTLDVMSRNCRARHTNNYEF